jgi:hypothetical protein
MNLQGQRFERKEIGGGEFSLRIWVNSAEEQETN